MRWTFFKELTVLVLFFGTVWASALIGHGMGRFDNLDAFTGLGVAITGDHQAGDVAGPGRLECLGHLRRCLAGPDHHGAALGWRWQMAFDGQGWLGLCNGLEKQAFEQ